jgi:acetylornithine deacetylase/succinyl-diaminopimelate desuccinylase-like protein
LLRLLVIIFVILLTLKGAAAQSFDNHSPVSVLRQYLRIPSVSGNEKEAGTFLHDFCKKQGLHTIIFTATDSSYNFAASLFPFSDRKPSLIFQHHIDVVQAEEPSDWTFQPFEGVIKDSIIYGRGALDAKGIGIMQVFALLKFKKEHPNWEKLPFNVIILALSGEEVG